MIKKIITLFKLGRKVAKSDILKITSKFQEPPIIVKILFKLLAFSFSEKNQININQNEGERLSRSLESISNSLTNSSNVYEWITWNNELMEGTFVSVPERIQIPEKINEQYIVELYSK